MTPSGHTFQELAPTQYAKGIAESGIPIFNVSGWFDIFTKGATQLFATFEKTNPSKLLLGAVDHGRFGDGPWWNHFGENPQKIYNGFNQERIRFLDHYLKGVENGVDTEPPVRIYVMNGEGWRFENEWPLKRQKMKKCYFGPENTLAKGKKKNGSDEYTADFTHNAQEQGTGYSRWNILEASAPVMRTDKDSKCLTYTMEKGVNKDTEVTGHPVVHLWVSSTANYGDFFVYLEDVDENGNAFYVTEGQLRAGFAKLLPNEDMLPKGSGVNVLPDLPWHGFKSSDYVDGIFAGGNTVELAIDLMPTSYVFKKGHNIRVSIAAADYPQFQLHPKLCPTNNPADPNNIVPTITVHREKQHRSYVELPIIPNGARDDNEDDDDNDNDNESDD